MSVRTKEKEKKLVKREFHTNPLHIMICQDLKIDDCALVEKIINMVREYTEPLYKIRR